MACADDADATPARASVARVAVTTLRLGDFRNHAALALDGDARHVVLAGDNGTGKTNVLEALSLLTPGRGLRRARLDEMARRGGPGAWTIFAEIDGPDGRVRLGTGSDGVGDDEARARRVRIDGEPARSADEFLAFLRVSWLTPAMDGLFTGPAGDRRRFLDRLVLALDPGHGSRVAAFEKAMRGRNRLLEDDRLDHDWLSAIETQMAELGIAVASARVETVACLARLIAASRLDSPFPHADLALEGEIEAAVAGGGPAAEAEDLYRARLTEGRRRDKAAGRTLDGPHRADLVVHHGPKAMPAALSSTGEQKALLLGLVLAHARLVGETCGRAPLLLLDEVAAHLDPRRRGELFDAVEAIGSQCWMTGTDAEAFAALGDRAVVWDVGVAGLRRRPSWS
ncbi:DNA replication/repair protein RecF [Siculibacillus lacustris]|uniref:DNA replication and repair protein RecF n=1 Tax=Siculibacillus lacustris TaxID=1549641 RepID=A0A4Q9VW95_9HYPH|nr:DNA replication/repair protein RecF [Siculibacillus lacustris]TBW40470.1 DNA replication/repair protein RecF [Siculibacillus lacustris]